MARPHSTHHSVESAVADVVQRCIEAGADGVDVAVEFAGAGSYIRIAAGAPLAVPAAEDRKGDISEQPHPPPATAAGLDVKSACLALGEVVAFATDESGSTVVHIERLHEVLAYKRREGRVIEAVVARMRSRAADGLGLAFHRGLRGVHRRGRALAMTVNAEPVAARDPFAPDGAALVLRRRELPFVVDGRVEAVLATPYALAAAADDPAAGRQGFFVYLQDRLIQAGGWSRLSVAGRSDGLARIAVDLPARAVHSFTWEATARRVLFPITVAPGLRALAFEAVTAPWSGVRRLGPAATGS